MKNIIFILALTLFSIGLTGCESAGPRYKDVRSYSEGLAPVKANNDRWGYINENQQWVIPPRFDEAREFKDGKAAVRMNRRWGFINKQGEWL